MRTLSGRSRTGGFPVQPLQWWKCNQQLNKENIYREWWVFSYPEQHTLSHVAPQKRQNLWHKNTHSCPSCSCTPEDMCRIPHTHSHLVWKTKEQFWNNAEVPVVAQDRLWALPSHMCFSVALGLYPGLHEQSKPPSFRSVQLCSQILSLQVCVLPRSNRRK